MISTLGVSRMGYSDLPLAQRNEDEDKIGSQIVDAALKIHRHLGPGLLESAYQTCLAYELRK
jgi:hypothetical protein